jgi:hypothetical protein
VNKKKQKNFVILGRAGFTATGPEWKKFLRRFFQKAAAFLLKHGTVAKLGIRAAGQMH